MAASPSPSAGAPFRGPATITERSLAPDLIRGSALLLIAVANSVLHLWGHPLGLRSRPEPGTALDQAFSFGSLLLVDGRAYPLFAALFGYGAAQIVTRQAEAGTSVGQIRRLLGRRGGALLLFGFVHAVLLWSGDVLGLYGLLGLALVAFVRLRDRWLLIWFGLMLIPFVLSNALLGVEFADGTAASVDSGSEADFAAAMTLRLSEWLAQLVLGPVLGMVGILAPMLMGYLAGRHRVLSEPDRHRRTLLRTALVGVPAGVLAGLPLALAGAGYLAVPAESLPLLAALHGIGGLAVALGYGAALGLAAGAVERRVASAAGGAAGYGRTVAALAATGRNSLSAYLLQSVVFVALLAPWSLGLGDDISVAAAMGLGAAVWLVSVLAAAGYGDRRGPAESVLRRIVYGDRGRAVAAPSGAAPDASPGDSRTT
ncbi:DUF418 domain-containing protein [Allonocardiopsis opalescens]|uniref:Putative membrane protein YeiB n=1 Tax=Allonocardiopsis opalescens TaxID=1144618 RepID=A0A2T0Q0U9_9ACTN|nr:DUF418 domain-containing protein [Allonocardiopsis opalescens]PRX97422.1 putative membrane protein YeiB [Allonocardiopsis opalescens]